MVPSAQRTSGPTSLLRCVTRTPVGLRVTVLTRTSVPDAGRRRSQTAPVTGSGGAGSYTGARSGPPDRSGMALGRHSTDASNPKLCCSPPIGGLKHDEPPEPSGKHERYGSTARLSSTPATSATRPLIG